MSLLAAAYCLVHDRGHSVVQLQRVRRRSAVDKNRKASKPINDYDVTNAVRRAQMLKILVVTPINNAVDVIGEHMYSN